jgi:CubicO group peptidase (beta-lactamase class C family)
MQFDVAHSRTLIAIEEGMRAGLHVGAQLCVMRDGQVLVDLAVGQARVDPAVAMTSDTLMLWLSAGKPLTAAAIAMLVERGLLAFDDFVAQHIPEFGVNGKDAITVRHILTHTAGIRGIDTSYPFATWEETLGKIYQMKVERNWVPGHKAGYHAHTSWYVLGELINRLRKTPHDRWMRENLLEPLEMSDTWFAMTAERYASYGDRIGYLYDTTVSPPEPLPNYDTELAATRSRPAASARGPIRQLATFYEMLRNEGMHHGRRILQADTVRAMTARQRVGMFDNTFRQTIDWGLGVIINSAHYGPAIPYQFGEHASPETFGHGGSQSSTGFCDPVHKLVVTLIFNGCPGEPAHDRRLRAVLKALYEDLSLA